MYIHMYIYVCIYTYVHTHMYIYIHTYLHVYIHTYKYIYIHTCVIVKKTGGQRCACGRSVMVHSITYECELAHSIFDMSHL